MPDNVGLLNHTGVSCTVYTPPMTRLKNEFCDGELSSNNIVQAYPVPGATQYKFYVAGVANPIQTNEPSLNLGLYPWFSNSNSFDISVRVSQPENAGYINHIGAVCNVSKPPSENNVVMFEKSAAIHNAVTLYPNPSKGNFTVSGLLDLERSQISLYDLEGRKVEFEYEINDKNLLIRTDYRGMAILTFISNGISKTFKVWINEKGG